MITAGKKKRTESTSLRSLVVAKTRDATARTAPREKIDFMVQDGCRLLRIFVQLWMDGMARPEILEDEDVVLRCDGSARNERGRMKKVKCLSQWAGKETWLEFPLAALMNVIN